MSIEILDKPVLEIHDGVTYHIHAIDHPTSNEQTPETTLGPRPIGYVMLKPALMERFVDDARSPYMTHDTMKVKGVIDGEAIYDKTVSPIGFLGSRKPFYDLRIGIARQRALRRVKALLR